jgi:hypothetical protein
MSQKWHPNAAKMPWGITPWATHGQVPSARSQKDVALAANGGHMGTKRGPKIVVFGIRFCHFLGIFPHSILELVYDSFFKDWHDFRIVFGDNFAYICLTFLEPLEPCFLTTVLCFSLI